MTQQQDPIRVSQVAVRLGVTPRAVLKWIRIGLFPNAYQLNPHAPNSPWRIPIADVDAFEARRKAQVPRET